MVDAHEFTKSQLEALPGDGSEVMLQSVETEWDFLTSRSSIDDRSATFHG